MEEDNQSPEQKESLEKAASRGSAFEELIRTRGWEFVKAWYQAKIQTLATALLLEEAKPISDFENERRELIGIRKLLGLIENDIKTFRDKIKNDKENTRPSVK